MGDVVDQLAVEAIDGTEEGAGQPRGALGRWPRRPAGHIGRRAADDPENLRRGRLLLERFGQLGVARLQLLEQAHVLDGDDRLVREGLHERDLLVGERLDLQLVDRDDPHQGVAPEHGDRHHRPDRVHVLYGVAILGIGLDIGDLHGSPLEGGSRRDAVPSRSDRVPIHELHELRRRVVRCGHTQQLTVEAEEERPVGAAQPDGVLRDRLEHRRQLEGRAADHLQHLAGRRLPLDCLGELATMRLPLLAQPRVLALVPGRLARELSLETPSARHLLGERAPQRFDLCQELGPREPWHDYSPPVAARPGCARRWATRAFTMSRTSARSDSRLEPPL